MRITGKNAALGTVVWHTAGFFWIAAPALAADAAVPSAGASAAKMLLGLLAVLLVMAVVAWLVRRMLPHGAQSASVAKLVGGLSLGTRERIVVLEVADHWLVVGIASGQMTSLATLPAPESLPMTSPASSEAAAKAEPVGNPFPAASTQAFAHILAKWMKPHA